MRCSAKRQVNHQVPDEACLNNTANLKVKAELTGDGRIQFEATGTSTIVVGGSARARPSLLSSASPPARLPPAR
jgi:hypothetical protein